MSRRKFTARGTNTTTEELADEAAGTRRFKLTPVSAIDAEPVEWLWEGRFPLAHLSLAAGKPDLGKSQFAVWLAAQVTTGTLPGDLQETPMGVIYFATEDSFAMTIRPRLEAARADLDRVFRIEPEEHEGRGYRLSLVLDVDELAAHIEENHIGLVVFDPLVSVVSGEWNKASDVRDQLTPLAEMLEQTRCSAVGLVHFRKAFGFDALEQISGSGAWGQVVRAAVAFVRDPDSEDEKQVIMSQAKNNLGRSDLPSLTYTFEPVTVPTKRKKDAYVSRIVWGTESPWTVEDILAAKNTEKAMGALDLATAWLAEYLAHGLPVLKGDIVKAADDAGHSKRTIERAKARLPIVTAREDGHSPWTWKLRELAAGELASWRSGDPTSPTSPTTPNNSLWGLAKCLGTRKIPIREAFSQPLHQVTARGVLSGVGELSRQPPGHGERHDGPSLQAGRGTRQAPCYSATVGGAGPEPARDRLPRQLQVRAQLPADPAHSPVPVPRRQEGVVQRSR